LTFDFGLNIFPREDAFIHGPKYGRGRLDPFFDIGVRRERASDQRPKVFELLGEVNEAISVEIEPSSILSLVGLARLGAKYSF